MLTDADFENLTEEELQAMGADDASICRDDFYTFIREAWSNIESVPFVDNWHIGAMAEHLQAVTIGQIQDLLINVPPGCSKSLTTCVLWPSWEWCRDASVRFFFASYDQKLSTRDSVRHRTLLETPWYKKNWPGQIRFKSNQDQKTYYETVAGGYRLATSIGGHGTGEHPDRIVVDDPHNVRKAESETERQNVIDWWDLTMPTRGLSRNARRVIIMQRLHHRDLSGHVIETGGYVHLCLPMRFEPSRMITTPLGWNDPRKKEGELLTPRQFDEVKLAKVEKSLGAYGIAGQLQQRPQPRGGGLFKPQWFNRRQKASPRDALRVRVWDRAATCLVAGTLVETLNGPVPIEQIRCGDEVLTRQGFKEVVWSGQSGVVQELVAVRFSNGSVLTGTADHKVWTVEKGWTDLSAVGSGGYTTVALNGEIQWKRNCPRWSFSEESNTSVEKGGGTTRHGDGTKKTGDGGRTLFIERSGESRMEKFPRDTTYTTATATGTITICPTSNAYRDGSITSFTGLLPNGINQTLQRNTTNESGLFGRSPPSTENSSVFGVEMNSIPVIWTRAESNSARPSARLVSGLMLRSNNALCAELNSSGVRDLPAVLSNVRISRGRLRASCAGRPSRRKHENRNHVAERVEEFVAGRKGIPVYDLTVKDASEFFANGILVHNSDGGCYTAGVLMAKDKEGTFYVEDCVHGQWEPNERNTRIVATAKRDRARYGPIHEPLIIVERERGSTGLEAFQRLAAQLAGHRVREDAPTGSKDVRAEPWSDQLAAMNVVICDGGQSDGTGTATWDVDNYVQEHLMFKRDAAVKRLGSFKDQVDASSMAFVALTEMQPVGELRVLSFDTSAKIKHPRLVVCDREHLPTILAEQRTMLLEFRQPSPVQEEITTPPPHSLTALVDSLTLTFADINTADYQEQWNSPVEPYGKPPAALVMTREHGKKLWAWLLKKREPAPEVYFLVDDGTRVAESVAKGIADVLRIPRSTIYFAVAGGDADTVVSGESPAPNGYVYDMVRASRGAVL